MDIVEDFLLLMESIEHFVFNVHDTRDRYAGLDDTLRLSSRSCF